MESQFTKYSLDLLQMFDKKIETFNYDTDTGNIKIKMQNPLLN